jgi:hypothetical protein
VRERFPGAVIRASVGVFKIDDTEYAIREQDARAIFESYMPTEGWQKLRPGAKALVIKATRII